jgi:RNA polymerase sigma-70 factor (ECF subfamily)
MNDPAFACLDQPAVRCVPSAWDALAEARVGRRAAPMNGDEPQSSGEADFSGLVEAIARRQDRAAFAALFEHFAPRIKTYLLRFRMPRDRAEEIAQDTMLTVWRKAATYDRSRAGAAAWIFAIARNQRIDALRREQRDQTELDPAEEPNPPIQPDCALSSSERDQRIRDALKCLPAEQVRVIELSFFDERPHAAIAQALNLPLGTVKSRARLAINRLRELLGDLQ